MTVDQFENEHRACEAATNDFTSDGGKHRVHAMLSSLNPNDESDKRNHCP